MNLHGLVRATEDLDIFVTIYRMKRATVRPLNRAEAEALRTAFDLEEE